MCVQTYCSRHIFSRPSPWLSGIYDEIAVAVLYVENEEANID